MWKKILPIAILSLQPPSLCKGILDRAQGETTLKEFSQTLDKATDILAKRPLDLCNIAPYVHMVLIPNTTKPIILGDLHGEWGAAKALLAPYLDKNLVLKKNRVLLDLGDFVDRGSGSIDVANLLLKIFIKNPKRTFLIQGNHETHEICGRKGKQYLRSQIRAQAKKENINTWETTSFTCFTKAVYAFSLLPQTVAIGTTADQKFYSFLLCSHAGPPGITIGSKGHYCNIKPMLKRFLKKASIGKSGYCKTAIPSLHNWANWTDFVADIPKDFTKIMKNKSGVYPQTRGNHAQVLSSTFMKDYLKTISCKKGNFSVDGFLCGHGHVPGGIVKLKNALTYRDLSPECLALAHDLLRHPPSKTERVDLMHLFQMDSWEPLQANERTIINTGDVFSCYSVKKPYSYATCSFNEERWQIKHKMIR